MIEGEIITDEIPREYAMASLLALSISAVFIIFRVGPRSLRRVEYSFVLVCVFSFMAAIFSIFHMNINSLVFSFILFSSIISIRIISFECSSYVVNVVSFLVLMIFVILSLIMYYPPIGRSMGGMHPNSYGACLIALSYFTLFVRSVYIKYSLFCLAIICAYIVSSRYAMISIFIIILLNYIFHNKKGQFSVRVLIFSIVAIFVTVLISFLNNNIISDALELNDARRGLGSGGSGRLDIYEYFWDQFFEGAFIGYGFRARDMYVGVHNGFMNTLLENGVIATAIIFTAIILRLFELFRYYLHTSGEECTKFYFIGMIACLFAALFQPQLINFGDPLGVVFLLVLASHPRQLAARAVRRVSRPNARSKPYVTDRRTG